MYRAPIEEIAFSLRSVAGLKNDLVKGAFGDLSDDLLDAILAEAGKFAADELAPLNKVGDESGALLQDGRVSTSAGFVTAYGNWREAGWNSLTGPEKFGGQGLPIFMSAAVQEFWNSANMALPLVC